MIEEQQKLLEDAKIKAKEYAYFMSKALENADLRSGLKYASHMLGELSTSALSPKNYYALWMTIFDYIRQLENYFKDDFRRGRKMTDVYEAVQHAPSLMPRLYLMITCGSVYIQSHQEGSDKILDDLIGMLKSVQNPTRGLFLRYYFLKLCKDRLPDTGSEYQSQGRGVEEAIKIIHMNLKESTNLWIRIGSGRDKAKKLKQKNELKMLIGENLMRLSSLEGVNIKVYQQQVLPKVLDLIRQSQDSMAQQYLLDCMIQGFPEEFHIHTLPDLLTTCSKQCQKQVDMKVIFIALMDRLSGYLATSGNVIDNIQGGGNIYEMFQVNIKQLINKSQAGEVTSTLNLYSAFLQFTLKCYPDKRQYVNSIILEAADYCQKSQAHLNDDCQLYISKFITHPLETMPTLILTMKEYPTLMKYLKFKKRRDVAKNIAKAVCRGTIDLTDEALVSQLLLFMQPLLKKQPDYVEISETLFKDQQNLVCKVIFHIEAEDVSQVWTILKMFIEKFVEGGEQRMKFTIPAAVFRLYYLARDMHKGGIEQAKAYKKIFDLVRNLIDRYAPINATLSIKLYMELVMLINTIDTAKHYDQFTYETAGEGLLLYESQVNDIKQKQTILEWIINACLRLTCISEENYDTLVSNITSFCAKIIKKADQCKILLSCCYLFVNELANPQKIHEILKKCAKLANTEINKNIINLSLLFDILDAYLYYTKQKAIITDKDDAIPQIVELIEERLTEEALETDGQQHIKLCQARWVTLEPRVKAE